MMYGEGQRESGQGDDSRDGGSSSSKGLVMVMEECGWR